MGRSKDKLSGRRVGAGIFSALLFCGAGVSAQGAPAAPAVPAGAEGKSVVEAAVTKLMAEADEIFADKSEVRLSMSRPRPVVDAIPPGQYAEVLKAMAGKLSGDTAKDMYVRYHLMYAVNRALPGLKEGVPKPLLAALIKGLPEEIKFTSKEVYTWDPYEIGRKHFTLMQSCMAVVGFAPFQRRVQAPESFQYMSGDQLAKAKAAYAEAKSLEGKFKDVYIKVNDMYDWRMGSMNWAVRQYRGELYYATLVKNPSGLNELVDLIGRAAGTNPRRAEDLAAFLDMAYDDGVLGGFDKEVLRSAARKLKAAVGAAEKDAKLPKGVKPAEMKVSAAWDYFEYGDRQRNLGEELFTVITGIETDHVPPPIKAEEYSRPVPASLPTTRVLPVAPSTQPSVLKAQEITVSDIDAAIARALPALEKFRPPAADLDNMSYRAADLPAWPDDLWAPGQGALSTWAMLAGGESYRSGWMQRRVNWVLNFDSPSTYDRAMRLEMLTMAPPSEREKIVPWTKRDAKWLLETQTDEGGWEVNNMGKHSTGWGDNVNSQYAMLGLWGATQANFEVPDATWQKIDKYWRAGQRPPGSPGAGAWAVIPTAALQKGANLNDFKNHVSASMTAGGVMSLYVTESFLFGDKRADVGQTLSPDLLHGVKWLDDNFSLTNLDGDSDFYYYIWTIQNVGQMTGYRTFNKVDWFREATARLINTQGADGLWTGPKGANVSTSFALLYLYQARGPLAICKLKIEPVLAGGKADLKGANAWNNRPNDLYNFTRDVSRKMEVPTNWQIADLDQPVYQLIESPILYLATSEGFKLSEAHRARLKEYLNAGGMLVCVPEGRSTGAVINAFKALGSELFPGKEPVSRRAGDSHPFYNLFEPVKGNVATLTYEGTVRPQMVIVERDIGRDLQLNKTAQREAFDLLENIYLFASGKERKRPRIATNYLQQHNMSPRTKLAAARIKHAGDFDPEPLAMPQLKALMADQCDVDLATPVLGCGELTKATKVAFLTMAEDGALTDEEVGQLKAWVAGGGTLWLDAAGGSAGAVDKVNDLAKKLGMTEGDSLESHEIWTGRGLKGGFDNSDAEVRKFYNARMDRPTLTGKLSGDHPEIVVCNGDMMSGVAGMNHWGIAGFSPVSARHLVANGLLLTAKENAPPPPTTSTAPATRPAAGAATMKAPAGK